MNLVRSNKGVSIIQVMVAFALMGVLSVALMKITQNQNKMVKTTMADSEIVAIINEMRVILSDPSNCTATFSEPDVQVGDSYPPNINNLVDGGKIDKIMVTSITKTTNPTFDKVRSKFAQGPGFKYGSGFVKVMNYEVEEVGSTGGTEFYLRVRFDKGKKTFTKRVNGVAEGIVKKISITKSSTGASGDDYCAASSLGASSIWKISDNDPLWIYYPSFPVGIGRDPSGAEFDFQISQTSKEGNMVVSGNGTNYSGLYLEDGSIDNSNTWGIVHAKDADNSLKIGYIPSGSMSDVIVAKSVSGESRVSIESSSANAKLNINSTSAAGKGSLAIDTEDLTNTEALFIKGRTIGGADKSMSIVANGGGDSSTAGINFQAGSGGGSIGVGSGTQFSGDAKSGDLVISSANDLHLATGSGSASTKFHIANNGHIGIGTMAHPDKGIIFRTGNTADKVGVGIYIDDEWADIRAKGRFHISAGAGGGANELYLNPFDSGKVFVGYGVTNQAHDLMVDGKLGVNTESPQHFLHVDGDAKIEQKLTVGGEILSLSDRGLKRDITPLQDILDKVLSLQGVNYRWKKPIESKNNFIDEKHIGLIAQDVEKVFPELIGVGKDGIKSVNYGKFSAVLIEAVKEQNEEYQKLKEKHVLLEQKLEYLNEQMDKLANKININ